MKIIQLIALLITLISTSFWGVELHSQDKGQLKFYERIYGEDDNDFDVMTANGKWADAAAVILCEKMHISIQTYSFKVGKPVEINGIVRRRVLIQNKSNLEDFTQYYFQKGETVGLKVVKPNGAEKEVDLSDAIEVKSEVPSFYKRRYIKSSYFKIAIPDLEVGDILEYYNIFRYDDSPMVNYEGLFCQEYPILKMELTFDLSKIGRAYFNTFNTENKFQITEGGGKNKKGKDKKNVNRLRIVEHDIEARPEDRFLNGYAYLPYFKLCVYSNTDLFPFLEKGDKLQNTFSLSDNSILNLFDGATKQQVKSLEKTIEKDMGVKEREFLPEAFFYSCRYLWNGTSSPNYYLNQVAVNNVDADALFSSSVNELSSEFFISHFSKYLERNKFEHDFIVVVPNSIGNIENVMSPGSAYYGIYVKEIDQIFWAINNHRNDYERPLALAEGGNGYRYKVYGPIGKKIKKIKDPIPENFVLPAIQSNQAGEASYLNVIVNDSLQNICITDSTIVKGVFKEYNYSFLPKFQRFIYSDYLDMYENKEVENARYFLFGKGLFSPIKYRPVNFQLKEKSKNIQKETFENDIKSSFATEKIELLDYEIIETGRTFHQNNMIVKSEFVLEDFLNKAGPNYILDAGKLIGGQRNLTDEEKEQRERDADLGFSKQFENHIQINIPEGYSVKGYDQFNVEVNNDYIHFISTAELEGQQLKIYTMKDYKNAIVPIDGWKDLVEGLEAAYNLSQKKLILSKK